MNATERFSARARRTVEVLLGLLVCGPACLAQGPDTPAPGGVGVGRPVVIESARAKVQVADVIIQGNKKTPSQNILPHIKTRPGVEFNQETLYEDVRKLYATKLFANVSVQQQTKDDGSLIIYFVVSEAPNVIQNITYNGAQHLKKDELEAITGLRRGMPMNPTINKQACLNIVKKYNEDGRPLAGCELLQGSNPADTEVVFQITEGPVVKVSGLDFLGNTFVSKGVLANHINSSTGFFHLFGTGKYNSMMADNDVVKLEEYYRSFGFMDAHVSRELRWSADQSSVVLVFHIHEGVRYQVTGTQVEGQVHVFSKAELERLAQTRSGENVSQAQIDKDQKAMEAYYGYRGYKSVIRPVLFYPEDQPGTVRVDYQVIQEGTPKRVGEIQIIGNTVTRQNVILRELPFYPGQILTYPDIAVAEHNLLRLGIFEANQEGVRPTVRVVDDPDSEFQKVEVHVDETRTGSLMFGVGVNSDAGLTGSIVLNERNFDLFRPPTSFADFLDGRAFRGADQELRLEAVPGTQVQRYSGTWRDPRVFDSLFSLTVGGYFYERDFNEYNESRLGTRITVGRQLNKYWSANVGIRVEDVGVHAVPADAPEDFQSVDGQNFLIGFRGGVARDTRDSFMRPTQGNLLDISYEQVTGDFNYPLFNIEDDQYFTLYQRADGSGRQVLAIRSQMGLAGSQTPVYDRFYAGGFRSIRGFQFRGVGPDNGNGFKLGGDFMFLNSLEYQVPIKANDQIYLVGFLDSGTVESRMEIKDYRVAAGFGVRFTVPMMGPVPIALDFGFPIVKGPLDNTQVFSFWLGFFH
jgi:outer membrane protein assembly complex protein YaeT